MGYSTEEEWTGKYWINGKKIYRKTGYISSIAGGTVNVSQVSNVEYIINAFASGTSSGYVHFFGAYNSNETRAVFQYDRNTGYFTKIGNGTHTDFVWWAEYTKTV